jgi:acetate kinase
VDELLRQRCGLLGFSAISGDVRDLLASDHPHAAEALELFAYRTSLAIASHAVALQGLDALVFTAGIGEHAAPARALAKRKVVFQSGHPHRRGIRDRSPCLGADGEQVASHGCSHLVILRVNNRIDTDVRHVWKEIS